MPKSSGLSSVSDVCSRLPVAVLLTLLLTACGPAPITNVPPQNPLICCFGDSLVAGVGAGAEEDHYPAVLGKMVNREVVAWGTPGDTTAAGLSKCKKFDEQAFGIVVVTLGGNDILRRVRWPETERNLRDIFQRIQATGAVVAFTGVTGPLNPTRNKHYKKICEEEGVLFIPDILADILPNPDLLADEVHPNAAGYRMVAQQVADALTAAGLLQDNATPTPEAAETEE